MRCSRQAVRLPEVVILLLLAGGGGLGPAIQALAKAPSRLEALTAEQATALFKQGKPLRLAVTELSTDVAAILAGHAGEIHLPAVKKLTPDVAAALAPHAGLLAIGVSELSDDTAAAFARQMGKNPCRMVDLNGLKKLSSPTLAVAALRREGHGRHSQPGSVASIPDDAAVAFATGKGRIDLSGLRSLSVPAATAFAANAGPVVRDGPEELGDEAAAALAKAVGPVSLERLTKLSPAARTALGSNPHISLPPPAAS